MNLQKFTDLDLPDTIQSSLQSIGYDSMTPVQSRVLPLALAGRDIIAQAKTGSGKTVSFGLVALTKLNTSQYLPQTLVLCPTRELADQIAEVIRQLARTTENVKVLTLTGGSSTRAQITSLEKGVHIVVGTPGRVEDHLRRGSLKLEMVSSLVLDEADRMLQMGFQDSIDRIVEGLPAKRQTLLLSATYPDEIQTIASRIMHEPEMISVDTGHAPAAIEQNFYRVESSRDRLEALQSVLLTIDAESVLIFCNTKLAVNDVTKTLDGAGFSVIPLHGDLEQKDRDRNLIKFTNRSVVILVATDVAARGIDIEKLDLVVNYELSKDIEVHIHRSGRTGRAGESGTVITLIDDADKYRIEQLEKVLGQKIQSKSLPAKNANRYPPLKARTVTLEINAGKKQKLRPGDILGALTGEGGVDGELVGKIKILNARSFVAVDRQVVKQSQEKLRRIKGRTYKTRAI